MTYSQNLNSIINNKQTIDTTKVRSFDPEYFILGTLSDYMGRFRYVDRKVQVDRYDPYEKPLVNYLTGYIKKELNIKVDTVFEKNDFSKMFSEQLSKKLNSFYGQKDELVKTKFETDHQVNSFLAGVYYRYGEKLDSSIYKIQLANSPKHQNCYELLKRAGCENILYQYLRNLPAQFILYFEPTDDLKKYLDLIEPEKVSLKESRDNYWDKYLQWTKGEMSNQLKKTQSEEAAKVKKAFKR